MINFTVTGDAGVVAYLTKSVPTITGDMRKSMGRIVLTLTRYVKEQKLSGQVLKNRTGTLRRKINGQTTEADGVLTGSVGVKLAYAAAHEYGFDGTVTVRQHLRRAKSGFFAVTDAHGTRITRRGIIVREHQRHMHLPERSFLRSSLRELRPQIIDELNAAVAAGLRD